MACGIDEYFVSDETFDVVYPINVRELSQLHWTPLEVARMAAQFLAPDEHARVLDIGAGVGKFCIAGGYYTQGSFTGIEQRKNFVRIGNKAVKQLGQQHVSMLHGNFMDINLPEFTGIYFFNSFHENIVHDDALDGKIDLSLELYVRYTEHLASQLKAMPDGTRLATYWLSITEIPGCYQLCGSYFNDLLKLWVKGPAV